jgi:hypothetical protein
MCAASLGCSGSHLVTEIRNTNRKKFDLDVTISLYRSTINRKHIKYIVISGVFLSLLGTVFRGLIGLYFIGEVPLLFGLVPRFPLSKRVSVLCKRIVGLVG